MDIPILEGRDFGRSDARTSSPVVILNEAMTKYWENGRAIGNQISVDNGQTWVTVVGVAGDVLQYGLSHEIAGAVLSVELSCAGPAWRATSVDPLRALRAE